MSIGELVALIVAVAALLSAFVALRKASAESKKYPGEIDENKANAADSITEAAQRAVELTRDSSETRITDLEKQIKELLAAIANLNDQVRDYRTSAEELSRMLHGALNKIDDYRAENLNLQEKIVRLDRDIAVHVKEISTLHYQIDQLLRENAELRVEIQKLKGGS